MSKEMPLPVKNKKKGRGPGAKGVIIFQTVKAITDRLSHLIWNQFRNRLLAAQACFRLTSLSLHNRRFGQRNARSADVHWQRDAKNRKFRVCPPAHLAHTPRPLPQADFMSVLISFLLLADVALRCFLFTAQPEATTKPADDKSNSLNREPLDSVSIPNFKS